MIADFEGKVALVTGAGGGIGLATAKAFATAGASVIVADRDEITAGNAAEGLRATGHNAIGVTCDVTDRGQVKAMIEQAVRTYGRLDAAFNNAGINCDSAPLSETEDDTFDNIVNVNLRGVRNCMKAELRQMMGAGKRCDRQLFLDRWAAGLERPCRLLGQQIRGDRPHARLGSRLCRDGHPHQCSVPGDHRQHPNGREGHEELRSRNRQSLCGCRTDRTLGRA